MGRVILITCAPNGWYLVGGHDDDDPSFALLGPPLKFAEHGTAVAVAESVANARGATVRDETSGGAASDAIPRGHAWQLRHRFQARPDRQWTNRADRARWRR
jgi:hypothetical protein